DLRFITAPDRLKEIPQCRVILLREKKQIYVNFPGDPKCAALALRFQRVQNQLPIVHYWIRQAADLPSGRYGNRHIVISLGRKIEVDRVHALRLFKNLLFGSREQTCREQCLSPGSSNPSRDLETEFSY